jgi:LPXTG-motif cell wall-anchored protein
MVKIDYEKKNGVASYVSKAELTEDGLSYRVQLTDADGNELMEYSVNPFTGYGETSFGNAVELPQTGVTSPRTAAAAAGALALTVSGLFAVLKSGFIRRKDQE